MRRQSRVGKRILASLLVVLMMGLMVSCGKDKAYSLGTGNIGGNYYSYGNAIAAIAQSDDVTINVKSTAGSAGNLRLMQNGFLDMAIVQSDILMDAYNGTGIFEGKPCGNVRAIAGLYTEECQIVVRADSDIYKVEDLYGRRISVGEEESGVRYNAEQILLANGIAMNRVDVTYLSFQDSAAALRDGNIDAFFCTAGAPTTAVVELSKETDIRIISLDDRTIDQLMKEYPCYAKCVIPAGTYQGQDEDITTLGVKAVLVVSANVPETDVKYIINAMFEHESDIKLSTSAGELNIEFATEAIPVPFHSGAAAYYGEKGINVSTKESNDSGSRVHAGQD